MAALAAAWPQPRRRRVAPPRNRRSGCETSQFLAEQDEVDRCRHDDGGDGAPTEIRDHERDVPPHGRATISTGGAANCVSVPPIETLTNNTPSVAYFSRVEGCKSKNCRASRSAQIVIAAGSVINEPSTGPIVRIAAHHAAAVPPPAATPEGRLSEPDDGPCRRERHDDDDEHGFRIVDRFADVVPGRLPPGVPWSRRSATAHKPKTTSTSPRK